MRVGAERAPLRALGLSLDGVVRISVEMPAALARLSKMELPVAEGDSDRSGLTANGKVPQAATTVGRQP